jgi:hypothetical protein
MRYVLVDGFQNPCDGEIILKFDRDLLVREGLEDREDKLRDE